MIKNAFAYITRKSLKSIIIMLVILAMSTLSLIHRAFEKPCGSEFIAAETLIRLDCRNRQVPDARQIRRMDDGRREGFVEDCLDFPVDFDEPGKRVLHDGLTFPHDIIRPALHAVSFLFLEEPAFCFPGNGLEPFFHTE